MPADPAHQLALAQLGDTQAAVPVAAAEEQAPIVGDHQDLGTDLHARGEGPAQETLCPVGGERDGWTKGWGGNGAWREVLLQENQ